MREDCIDIRDEATAKKLVKSVGDALYAIGGKWKLPILIALFGQRKRFNDLKRAVEGISARVLSNELKDLEANGLITREVYKVDYPATVFYEITEYSYSLQGLIFALANWGKLHLSKIKMEQKKKLITIQSRPYFL